jgi:hypothetical protein
MKDDEDSGPFKSTLTTPVAVNRFIKIPNESAKEAKARYEREHALERERTLENRRYGGSQSDGRVMPVRYDED